MSSSYYWVAAATFCLLLGLGCDRPPEPRSAGGDPNSPAGKAGKAVYKLEKQTEKAADTLSRKLDHAAQDAHAGYKSEEEKRKADQ